MNLDAVLNASDCARVAGVTRQNFDYWRRTGKLKPAFILPTGRKLYRVRDVLAVEANMAAKSGRM